MALIIFFYAIWDTYDSLINDYSFMIFLFSFSCVNSQAGFYADIETKCQVKTIFFRDRQIKKMDLRINLT